MGGGAQGGIEGLLARYDDAWRRRDVDAILELHAPGASFEDGDRGERSEGEAVREELTAIFDIWPDLVFTTRRHTIRDGLAVVEWTAAATHSRPVRSRGRTAEPTGRRVEWNGVDILELEDGLVQRKAFYMDRLSLLRQVGLA